MTSLNGDAPYPDVLDLADPGAIFGEPTPREIASAGDLGAWELVRCDEP